MCLSAAFQTHFIHVPDAFNQVGLTGDIYINENGDREADYTLNDLDAESGVMQPVASFFGARRLYEKLEGMEIQWPNRDGPPPDVPHCGFLGDHPRCLPEGQFGFTFSCKNPY